MVFGDQRHLEECASTAGKEKQNRMHDHSDNMRSQYHKVLVEQLGNYIRAAAPGHEDWLAPFLAEMVLRFSSDGHTRYEDIEKAVNVLLEKV